MVTVPDKRPKARRRLIFHSYVHCLLSPTCLWQRLSIGKLKIPGGAEWWEMNPIDLGAFHSDFPRDWVKQQNNIKKHPTTISHRSLQAQKSLSPPSSDYSFMYCTLNTRNPGTCWELPHFGPRGFQGLQSFKWTSEKEQGCGNESKLTCPSAQLLIISGFLMSSRKANKAPGALPLPRLSLQTERAKFRTKPNT